MRVRNLVASVLILLSSIGTAHAMSVPLDVTDIISGPVGVKSYSFSIDPGNEGAYLMGLTDIGLPEAFSFLAASLFFDPNGPGALSPVGSLFSPGTLAVDLLSNSTAGQYIAFVLGVPGSATGLDLGSFNLNVQVVPLPAAIWLLGSALVGMGLLRRRRVG